MEIPVPAGHAGFVLVLLLCVNSGGIVLAGEFRAPTRLRLAPLEVFPQRSFKPLRAQSLFGGFWGLGHRE
jgi:hypothetical protein